MTFEKEGFLSREAEIYAQEIIKKHQEIFNLCFDVNKFVHEHKFKMAIHNGSAKELILACLLIRQVNIFQSIILLTRLGLIVEAKILLRSMVEGLFITKACYDDEKFITKYILSDQMSRLKLLNAAKNNPDRVFDDLKDAMADDWVQDIKKDIDENNIEELRIQQLAEKVGLKSHYDSAYRLLSNPTHGGPRSLEEYLVLDDSGKVETLNSGPLEKGYELVLITALDTLCIGSQYVFDVFNINISQKLEEYRAKALKK